MTGAIQDKEVVVFDLDGTVYIGERPVEGVPATIERLRERDISVFFVSNNSSRDVAAYIDRLGTMGIRATSDDVVLSTDSVVSYLLDEQVTKSYVVGTPAMRERIAHHNIDPTSDDPTHVVVGFDRTLTYEKVRTAALHLQDGGTFVAAHPDVACPTPAGPIPDCGAITALLETATDREPDRVLGKPDPSMLDPVYERAGCDSDDILLVGDRLSTDIQLAENAGVDSVLVRSGAADDADVAATGQAPDAILDSAADLT